MKFIYHHLGLGNHIVNNGMIRHFYKKYGELTLFAYKHNVKNVQYMYRDLENFQVLGVESDAQADYYISNQKLDCLKIGFGDLSGVMPDLPFDKAFYKLVGLDFSVRFDEFYFERNLEKEEEVCKTLNPDGEKYIFVLDDPKRGYNIDMTKVADEYKVIRNDFKFKMFDYIKLLENAEEIHMMQTGFLDMVNSYKMYKPKIYRHNYVRNYPASIHSKGLNEVIGID